MTTDNSNLLLTSEISIEQSAATSACIHHLRLAAMFFETAEEIPQLNAEIDRQTVKDHESWPLAMRKFLGELVAAYDEIDHGNGELTDHD